MVLDKKDKRILYELDRNARQSLSQIGKKVGLPKNVVSYRIKRLESRGVIRGYYTVVDASRLGYFSIRLYLSFQNTTPKVEKQILDHFIKNSRTWWVASAKPLYDATIIMWVNDIKEFYTFWEQTLKSYGRYFRESLYSIYVQAVHYNYEYLIDRKTKQDKPDIVGGNKRSGIDELEMRILRRLAGNAKTPLTVIAKELSVSVKKIQYRLKKLMENKIIIGFRTNIDLAKIGFHNYRLNLYLSDHSQKKKIDYYIAQNPYLIYINRAIGHADLEYELHFRNMDEFHKFIDDIKNRFSESIRNYDYFIFKKVHKEQFMPLD